MKWMQNAPENLNQLRPTLAHANAFSTPANIRYAHNMLVQCVYLKFEYNW